MGRGFPERRFDGFASLVVKETLSMPYRAGHLIVGTQFGMGSGHFFFSGLRSCGPDICVILLPMPCDLRGHSIINGERMRLTALPILLIIATCSALTNTQAMAQSASNIEKDTPQRWVSHQMFQPPPRDSERSKISENTIEEIRRLYLEAEKEILAKTPSKNHQQQP